MTTRHPSSDFHTLCRFVGGALAFAGTVAVLMSLLNGRGRWLEAVEPGAVTVDAHAVNPAHEGKLIHLVGTPAECHAEFADPAFGVTARGYALVRQAAVYAYAGGDGGGGDGWYSVHGPSVCGGSPEAADQDKTVVWAPRTVHIGAFTLGPEVVMKVNQTWTGYTAPTADPHVRKLSPADRIREQVEAAAYDAPVMPFPADAVPPGWRLDADGALYQRQKSDKPTHGDKRVKFRLVRPAPPAVTLLGRQVGDAVEPMPTPGNWGPFLLVMKGDHGRAAVFQSARDANRRWERSSLLGGAAAFAAGAGLLAWMVRAGRHPMSARRSTTVKISPQPAADP